MKLLKNILKIFRRNKINREIVAETENVTRFIFNKKYFGSSGIKYNNFIPPKDYPNEISVYRTDNMQPIEIKEEANRVGQLRKRQSEAGAKLYVKNINEIFIGVTQKNLYVRSEPMPHPMHANIESIPIEKAARLLAAKQLANISSLVNI